MPPYYQPPDFSFTKRNFQLWKNGSGTTYTHAAVFKGLLFAAKNTNQLDVFNTDYKMTVNVTVAASGTILTLVATDDYLYAAVSGLGIYRSSDGFVWALVFAAAVNIRGGAADNRGGVVFNSITTPFNCYYSLANGDPGTWVTVAANKQIQAVWNPFYYLPENQVWIGYYSIGQYKVGADLPSFFVSGLRNFPTGQATYAFGEIGGLIACGDANGVYYGSVDKGLTFSVNLGSPVLSGGSANPYDMITYDNKIYVNDGLGNILTISEDQQIACLSGSGSSAIYGTRINNFNEQIVVLGYTGNNHLKSLNP